MKKNKIKLVIILVLLLLTTGCAKALTDSNNKAVKNEKTGQTLMSNILCKPTNPDTTKIYEEYKVDLSKLPECSKFKVTSGKYEGLWNTFFVKPLAFILLKLGKLVNNYGLSVIIISLLIRFVAYPITKKNSSSIRIDEKSST